MTPTVRQAQIFAAAVAVFLVGSCIVLESQTVQLERQCVAAGQNVTECKLRLRGR